MESLNFKTPLRIGFLIKLFLFIVFYMVVFYFVRREVISNTVRFNTDCVHNVSSYITEYMDAQGLIVMEISRATNSAEKFTNIVDNKNIHQWLSEYQRVLPDVLSFVYVSQNGRYVHVPYSQMGGELIKDYKYEEQIWYRKAKNSASADIIFYSIGRDYFVNNRRVVTISLPIYDTITGDSYGVLGINLDVKRIALIFEHLKTPSAGVQYLLTEEGAITNGKLGISDKDIFRINQRIIGNEGYFVDNDVNKYIFYSRIGDKNWYVINEIEKSIVDNQYFNIMVPVTYGMVLFLVVLLICWWWLRISLTSKYNIIVESIKHGVIKQPSVEKRLFDAIHSNQLQHDTIANESLNDGLTGLKNRRAFDVDVERYNTMSNTYIALLDIDNFKKVNDTWGHRVGDVVLKTTAELGTRLRGLQDIEIYRYGGEEFAVLFHNLSIGEAFAFLEEWRVVLNSRRFRESDLKVSFSAGICKMGEKVSTDVFVRVDKLLYKAKISGKNKTITESEISDGICFIE